METIEEIKKLATMYRNQYNTFDNIENIVATW